MRYEEEIRRLLAGLSPNSPLWIVLYREFVRVLENHQKE